MNQKLAIVIIALVGIGLYALPATMALFAGQHSFTNLDETGNQVECQKCHGDVQAELSGAVDTNTGTKPPHADMKCEFCHRLQIGQSSGDSAYALIKYANDVVTVNPEGKMTIVNGSTIRYAVIPVGDYEAGQYPTTINNADVMAYAGTGNRTLYVNGPPNDVAHAATTVWGTLKTPSSVSFSAPGAALSLTSNGTALCGGQLIDETNLSKGFKNQTTCKGAGGKVYPLVVTGIPLDPDTATQFTAFSAKLVTWSGTSPLFTGAGSRAVNKGSAYHAASLVACMDCHGGSSPVGHETVRLSEECELCHYGADVATPLIGANKWTNLEAGGFGMGLTNALTDTGAIEVHKAMVVAQDSISVFGGRYAPASNDACIGCHTHVDVNIEYTRPSVLTYSANIASYGEWNVDNFGAAAPLNVTQG